MPNKYNILIFEPTTDKPWVGFFQYEHPQIKKIWRDLIKASSPSHVHYWPILKKHKKDFQNSTRPSLIFVITGPGSFSFTRSAVNIANGLGFAWDVPVIGQNRDNKSARAKQSAEVMVSVWLAENKNKKLTAFSLKTRATPFYKGAAYKSIKKNK